MKKANKSLIVNKAVEMAKGYVWCFTNETSTSYKKDFAKKRFENLIYLDVEVEKAMENDNYANYEKLFIKTFIDKVNELLPQRDKLEEELYKSFK